MMRVTVPALLPALALIGCPGEPARAGPSSPALEAGAGPPDGGGAPAPGHATGRPAAAPPFEGTTGILEVDRDRGGPAVLTEVRAAAHEGFDRVVFELAGPAPGYRVEYVDRPVLQCGSGEAVAIAGDAWLAVRLVPAQAHDDRGKATAGERERRPGLRVVREIELTCDFEADVTWVIGVSSPNRYRVLELSDPTRIVVDVRH